MKIKKIGATEISLLERNTNSDYMMHTKRFMVLIFSPSFERIFTFDVDITESVRGQS